MNWESGEGSFFFSSKDNDGKPVDIYRFASSKKVISDCESSLKRLGTDYIDLFQIHWPDKSTPVYETMEALSKLMSQGKIRAAGVCNYPSELLAEASNVILLASNQVPYSMVRREIETDVVPYCLKNNIGILAYSPIQRGLLSGKIKPGHKFNEGDTRPDTPYYKEPNFSQILALVGKLEKIAIEKGCTASQLVLSWTIHQPGITCALAGARNAAQAKENSKASGISLSSDEINLINSSIKETKIDLTI
jgi:aryl-alcohol dehydrogenase-like predicted oxidoreductase